MNKRILISLAVGLVALFVLQLGSRGPTAPKITEIPAAAAPLPSAAPSAAVESTTPEAATISAPPATSREASLTPVLRLAVGAAENQVGVEADGERIGPGAYVDGMLLDFIKRRIMLIDEDGAVRSSVKFAAGQLPLAICAKAGENEFGVVFRERDRLHLRTLDRAGSVLRTRPLEGLSTEVRHHVGGLGCVPAGERWYLTSGTEVYEIDRRGAGRTVKVPGMAYVARAGEFLRVTASDDRQSRRLEMVDARGVRKSEFPVNSRFTSLLGVASDTRSRIYVLYKEFLESEAPAGAVRTLYYVIEAYDERGTKLGQTLFEDHGDAKIDWPITIADDGKIFYLELQGERLSLFEVKPPTADAR